MAIYVVTGRPRSGKTFFIARQIPGWLKEAKKASERGEKFRVYSNLAINIEYLGYDESIIGDIYKKEDRENVNKFLFYWRNIDTWNWMEKGVIIVDEATRYFNARKWALLSEETEIKIQQHGHEDLDIWATTQHFTRIDVTMRVLVESFFDIETIIGKPDNRAPLKLARWTEYTLEELVRKDNMGGQRKTIWDDVDPQDFPTGHFVIWNRIGRLYNTRQMVVSSKPMPLRHNVRICDTCGYEQVSHA